MIASSPFSTPLFALASPLACPSRLCFSRYPTNGELARRPRPVVCRTAISPFLGDVVDLTNEYNLPVVRLSFDQEKTFDRVDWPFLFATLAKMGLRANFIRWVKILYTVVRSSVLVNGFTSRPFKPSRGVRQGCPLSSLLYVLSMEVLADICPLLS